MSGKISLLSESSDSEVEFTINKNYADKYDYWRNKEEMQKLKDLSKDISDSSSSSESEEDPVMEKDFFRTLSLLKGRDPRIYDENEVFFKKPMPKKPKVKKEKPMFMKDYERELVLKQNGKFVDEDEEAIANVPPASEELDEIAMSFKTAAESGSEDEQDELGGLFQVRKKTKQEAEQEDEDYIEWLKGNRKHIDKETEKDLSYLRDFWNDPNLDDNEKFLRDFFLNRRYKESKSDGVPSYAEITMDAETLLEDEKTLEEQEIFEHKYNYRFEEPDPEFIKRYPRTIGDSLRRVNNKRQAKREDYYERKKREKEEKREELKRLKALKRKEIEEKFFKLKETIGKDELNFDEDDIESDFDPDKHDEKMSQLFNEDYYAEAEEQKPEFLHDEEIDDENWNHWTREQNKASEKSQSSDEENDCASDGDKVVDRKAEFEKEMVESTQGKKKGRKKSLFAKIISQPKPLYDPNGKSFEEYLDEYYKLDYEDIVGDMPVRFRYRKVIPNDFGLTTDEILAANDKELNRWCSVKKTCQYRRDEEEFYDVQAFKKRAQNIEIKQKILPSVYAPEKEEDVAESNASNEANPNKRKRKRSKKFLKNNTDEDKQKNSTQDNTLSVENNLESSFINHNTLKRKRNFECRNESACDISKNNADNLKDSSTLNNEQTFRKGTEHLETSASKKNSFKKKKKANLEKRTSSLDLINLSNNKEYSLLKTKDEENFSYCNTSSTIENGAEDINSMQNKSKRKRKRKSKQGRKGIDQSSLINKELYTNAEIDKRLALPNERLAAFGINPKKFKNSIIYSKKF